MRHADSLTKSESRRICFILLHGVIVIGIIIGAYLASVRGVETTGRCWWLHQFIAPVFGKKTVLAVFRNTFLVSAAFCGAAFISGFFTFGQPFALALLILRGMGIGASASVMYMAFGTKAISAVMVLVLPKAAVLSFLMALSVRESFKMSNFLLYSVAGKEHINDSDRKIAKLYLLKFAVIIAAAAIAAIPDSLITHWFIGAN